MSISEEAKRADQVDPDTHVQDFINRYSDSNAPTIRRFQGVWYRYGRGRFVESSDEEIKGLLIKAMKFGHKNVTQRATGNTYAQLIAELQLPATQAIHSWINTTRHLDEIACFQNGMVKISDLCEGSAKLNPPSPLFFNLNALDFDFVSRELAGEPTNLLGFLQEVFPDEQAIRTLRQWFGYTLTHRTNQQKMLFLLGPRRSGKGTIATINKWLVGKLNTANPTLDSLAQQFGLWPLIGKPLACIGDARLTGRGRSNGLIVERLLSISGEDHLTIDRKHKIQWTGKLDSRLLICSNELPSLEDASGALASRMIILQTPNSFLGREDLRLKEKLKAELPAIFWWAVDGLKDLQESGGRLYEPESSVAERLAFERIGSQAISFLEDCCDQTGAESDRLTKTALYAKYQVWCSHNHIRNIKEQSEFWRDMRAAWQPSKVKESRPAIDGKRERQIVGVRLIQG